MWHELLTGVYRDDWEKLLSEIFPVPPYPRPAGLVIEGMGDIVLIVVILFLSVILVIVARMRFI